MIIKTKNKSYIVKFRKIHKYFDDKTIDNYGRIHRTCWKEPIIYCTIKEYQQFATDSFSQWTGASQCRYTDNYDEKFGYESALNKALAISLLSDDEKKTIIEQVMAQKKIHQTVVKPYMKTIDKRAFINEMQI